jgi:hypothetical protein
MRCLTSVHRRRLAALASFTVAMAACGQGAQAEGFFERIFGVFSSPRPQPTVPKSQPRYSPYSPNLHYSSEPPSYGFDTAPAERPKRSFTGHYRTVCVRLCDGYYFPISNGISSGRFVRDANICQSRCGSETRLFSMPASAPDIKNARDQAGMSYARLPNAFVYRKKRIASCSCRPAPWSHEERARHASYAEEQKRKIAEHEQRAREQLAAANGVPADVARTLFNQYMAEVLPPAPDQNWQNAEPEPLTIAMSTLPKPLVIEPSRSSWPVSTQPPRPSFEVRQPLAAPPPLAQPAAIVRTEKKWLSRLRGTDPLAHSHPDGH